MKVKPPEKNGPTGKAAFKVHTLHLRQILEPTILKVTDVSSHSWQNGMEVF